MCTLRQATSTTTIFNKKQLKATRIIDTTKEMKSAKVTQHDIKETKKTTEANEKENQRD